MRPITTEEKLHDMTVLCGEQAMNLRILQEENSELRTRINELMAENLRLSEMIESNDDEVDDEKIVENFELQMVDKKETDVRPFE